ncbi:MAG TPA: lysine--tRNA ligase [Candidatus Paceibacterota bacterium]|jgi:lysyl-tRNA synthetase class 2|nr:lysine--tRNA ligase [Candidatus Paceibacterota bacterium]
MSSIDEIRDTRIKKLELLKTKGINPYPAESKRELSLKDAGENFDVLEKAKEAKWISGRIMSIRGQGAIVFITLNDGTGTFQGLLKKNILGADKLEFFSEVADIGDFVEIQGTFFTTNRGEKTMEAKDWRMLSKSLRPLPEKWHGLTDVEERFRKRYLEIATDRQVFDRFILRGNIIKEIRKFFDDLGFLEIETPILKNKAGGAMALPFVTHHNDLDIDMKLRISLEIEHKMIMAGGYTGVYEIGKNFRNEGSDPSHIQEFTMMEWYSAYHTLEDNIAWTEQLLKHLAKDIVKKIKFTVFDKDGNSTEVDFEGDWPRVKFSDLLKKYANIDMNSITDADLKNEALKYGIDKDDISKTSRANMLDFIYKHTARPKLINPTFVTHYPGDLKPLAQQDGDGTALVAQLLIGGAEITNQYAELVDPLKQRELFEKQMDAKDTGDEETMEIDEDFIIAMEHGMPPMTGFGMGIDRLMAIFAEQKNLRDTIFFPIMRPRENVVSEKKDKEVNIVTAIVNSGIQMEEWQVLNTIAHLSASFAGRSKNNLFKFDSVKTGDNKNIKLNIQHAILIKKAESSDQIRDISEQAEKEGLEIAHFTKEMIETTNDNKVAEMTKGKNYKDVDFFGLLIFGPKSKVEALTSGLKLY